MSKLKLHPLLTENEDGTKQNAHYDGKKENFIQRAERKYTVDQMIAFCSINIDKYEDRQDLKGQKEKDLHKIKKYGDYKRELNLLLSQSQTLKSFTVAESFRLLNIKWRY